jgi:hypothetical protein
VSGVIELAFARKRTLSRVERHADVLWLLDTFPGAALSFCGSYESCGNRYPPKWAKSPSDRRLWVLIF